MSSWFADNAADPRDPTGKTIYPTYDYQRQVNDNRLKVISIGLSIPILDRFSAQTNKTRKRIAYNDARYSYQQTVNAATKEVINAYMSASRFINVIKDDPKFVDPQKYLYLLDTLSPAKNFGLLQYGLLFPVDLKGDSRTSDGAPDAGAFERVGGK